MHTRLNEKISSLTGLNLRKFRLKNILLTALVACKATPKNLQKRAEHGRSTTGVQRYRGPLYLLNSVCDLCGKVT